MNRSILLLEPNYKNKYPPMGLMKIATYFRRRGDSVRFFKGDLKNFAATLLCEEFLSDTIGNSLRSQFLKIRNYIKTGKTYFRDSIFGAESNNNIDRLEIYRNRYKNKAYPKFDRVFVTTLFTFYWNETIDTINFAKLLCRKIEDINVGGIAASLVPEYILKETGIQPHIGLLWPGDLDKGDKTNIDRLPLDYSILQEIDYKYMASDAYFAYTTRGCMRNCPFCAVKTLEPKFVSYIGLSAQMKETKEKFGEKKDLLLLDNNVLFSDKFDTIIESVKKCGFAKGASYIPPNEYIIAVNNLKNDLNIRAYIKNIIALYDETVVKLPTEEQGEFYIKRENVGCLYEWTATKEGILSLDNYFAPIYERTHKRTRRARYIDFNQGIDARKITNAKMKKLSEINIRPLRLAFDSFALKDAYEKAVRLAVKHGITNLSNYLLYNYEDTPEDLYNRLKFNVDLCDELHEETGLTIYSFPMKYHPIKDPEYFSNRDYIGPHWNKKFIRAIQAVLNATKGKIGVGKSFFEEAFGKDIDGYFHILWMPEAFIIYRMEYKDNKTKDWWASFSKLSGKDRQITEDIIRNNRFSDLDETGLSDEVRTVLQYYKIRR